jgi:hypothetical protein
MSVTRKMTLLSLCFTVLLLLAALPLSAQDASNPQGVIIDYYNAINSRDYTRAYGMWWAAPQDYTTFANGFATTSHVEPYVGELQLARIGGTDGRIPAVLLSLMTDGTTNTYAGCIALHQAPGGAWAISDGLLQLVAADAVPNGQTINAYLAGNCYTADPAFTPVFVERAAEPYSVFFNYYDDIDVGDYATAYSLWLSPIDGPQPNGQPSVDYRPAYSNFVNGYANTLTIAAYAGDYQYGGPSAGHAYLDGMLPVVLVSQQSNGTVQAYSGCYVMGRFPGGQMGIVNGELSLFANETPSGSEIVQQLATNCFNLGIPS